MAKPAIKAIITPAPTTEITDRVRDEYGLAKDDIVIMGNDGVHPGEAGAFYVSYVIIKQQDDNAATVAKVEIDAATGAITKPEQKFYQIEMTPTNSNNKSKE